MPWLCPLLVLTVALAAIAALIRAARKERDVAATRRALFEATAKPEGTAWRALMASLGHATEVDALATEARWALRPEPTQKRTLSYFGGAPCVPADFVWPMHRGEPLGFLGQLDLAEIAQALPSWPGPRHGVLAFFACETLWTAEKLDDATSARVLFFASGSLERRDEPDRVPDSWRFVEQRVRFVAYEDPPPELSLHEAASEAVDEVRGYLGDGGTGRTRVLGHADAIQHPMEESCERVARGLAETARLDDATAAQVLEAATTWRLLLQLDEGSPEMAWGDAGLVYFWIREADLAAGRFDRVWAIIQHH